MQRHNSILPTKRRILLPKLRTNTRGTREMKIIHIDNIRIIMQNRTDYKIRTPLGILNNINDAIELYPNISNHQRISRCPICGLYFIKYGKEDNARKYCSSECAERYNKINKKEIARMWQRDKYLRDKNKTILNDEQNRSINWEFHQNDTFWGLGNSNIQGHAKNDFDYEHNIIQKELKRYGLKV